MSVNRMSLNDGSIMPKQCIETLAQFNDRSCLRRYNSAGECPDIVNAICERDGVKPGNVFIENGSGPVLKMAFHMLFEDYIRSSWTRMASHLVGRPGVTMVIVSPTYEKVVNGAIRGGVGIHPIVLDEANGFQLDLKKLEAAIQKPCIVYLPNPNNPTGNLLVTRDEIIDLVERYPKNTFWVDEAYVQYMDPKIHQPVSDLVPKYDNLFVSRSFSFAYGLAGIHVGYLIAPESFIERMEKKSTPYRVGKLQESVVVTALRNADEHLRDVRALCAQEQARIGEALDQIDGITWYPSSANFILCKWPDTNTTTKFLADMLAAGVRLRPFAAPEMANHFRITLGLPEDTDQLLEALQVVTHYRGSEALPPPSQQAVSEDAAAVGA